jgi:hypothetical protein
MLGFALKNQTFCQALAKEESRENIFKTLKRVKKQLNQNP